jgi:hypothetical protein
MLKETKTVNVGYSGGSQGLSIPLPINVGGFPVRYRVGQSRGHIVKHDKLLKTSQGQLLITNQRLFRNAVAGSEPLRCRSRRLPVIASTKMGLRFGKVLRNDLISLY